MTEYLDERDEIARRLCVQFLAEAMESRALDICALRSEFTPDDLRLLDGATATVFEVVVELSRRNIAPTVTEVHVALMNAGALGGPSSGLGQAVKNRMLDVVTTVGHAERLFDTAVNLLTVIFRNRLASAGSALESAAWGMKVPDAFDLMLREGTVARDLRTRITRLEATCGRWTGAQRGEMLTADDGQFDLDTQPEAAA